MYYKHDLEIVAAVLIMILHDNTLFDLCGMIEDATHYLFIVENIQVKDMFLMIQSELFSP